ncbi:MAG: hypothetical protein GW947_03705 [Candidatus Pacebacteria bacterium]|nr:hypothetical protein [Candidatus Paceibacterota bacterium]
MQPHSMCALAVAGYVWNRPAPIDPKYQRTKFNNVELEFTDHRDKTRKIYYNLEITKRKADEKELDIRAVKSSGDLACTLEIRRASNDEGSKVTVVHQTQHVSGLKEIYNLYKDYTTDGHHENSTKYGKFKAIFDSGNLDRTTCEVRTELVRKSDGWSRVVSYKTKIPTA